MSPGTSVSPYLAITLSIASGIEPRCSATLNPCAIIRPWRSQNALDRSIVSFMIDEYAMRMTVSTISSTTEPIAFLTSSRRTGSCAILLLQLPIVRKTGDLPELVEFHHAIPHRRRVAGLLDLGQHLAHHLARGHQRVNVETGGLEAELLDFRHVQPRHHAAGRVVEVQRDAAAKALGHR